MDEQDVLSMYVVTLDVAARSKALQDVFFAYVKTCEKPEVYSEITSLMTAFHVDSLQELSAQLPNSPWKNQLQNLLQERVVSLKK